MDYKALDRVRKLLRLATDPKAAEGEARNAAVEAARLMKLHSFDVWPREPPRDEEDAVPVRRASTRWPVPRPAPQAAAVRWAFVRVSRPVACAISSCAQPIARGQGAWHRVGSDEFIHDWDECAAPVE